MRLEQDGGEGAAEGHPWRELALRLLSEQRPDGARAELRLFAGEIPENVPTAIPVPEGMAVVGGMVRSGARYGEAETEVVMDAPVGAEAVLETYRALMRSEEWSGQGWTERGWHSREERGFASRPVLESAVFCRGRRGPALVVNADAGGVPLREDGGSKVRLLLIPAGRDTPCADEDRGWSRSPASVIPLLTAPPGSYEIDGGSSSYGGDAENATTSLRTDLSPEELAAHYASQFEAAGWTRVGEGSDGPLAWSSWEVPDEDREVWKGVFFAARFPGSGGCYELQVSVRLVDA